MDQWSDSKPIFQYAPVQTVLLFAFTNINGLVWITLLITHGKPRFVLSLSIQHSYFKAHSTFSQLHTTWDTYTEVSFHSLKKKKNKQPKLKQSVPIFKRIDPFKQFLVMRLRELDSSHRVFPCSLPANPSWQTFISDTDADDSVHCRWTDEP